MSEPAYLTSLRDGSLREKVAAAREMLKSCRVCPRNCEVDRLGGDTGFCGIGEQAVVASAHPHFGEESPLVGHGGSGTIFFTSCNLKCLFCQNYEISRLMEGQPADSATLAAVMLHMQQIGCHNINFVTPSHVVPQILDAVLLAAGNGLRLPLVYNTGGYDALETLRLLDRVVDIYMPDLKFMDSGVCEQLMSAPDYPETVRAAIREMHRQVGDLDIDPQGIAVRGLLVRHLVMPGDLANTRAAMRFLASEVSRNTYVNVMNQYRPCGQAHGRPDIGRAITREEYAKALEIAAEEGITRLDERHMIRWRFL